MSHDSQNKKGYELHTRGLLMVVESNIKELGTAKSISQEYDLDIITRTTGLLDEHQCFDFTEIL
jgi:hypothetical protein